MINKNLERLLKQLCSSHSQDTSAILYGSGTKLTIETLFLHNNHCLMVRKLLFTFSLLLAGITTATAQLIVESRPEAPRQLNEVPAPEDDSFFRIGGEWAVKRDVYQFVQPRYAKKRPGMKYVAGKWKKVSGGWMWREGVWKAK